MTLPATIGIAEPGTEKFTTDQQVDIAMDAEAAGFDWVLVPETWGRDAFTRAGHIAAHTESVTLGTGIVPVHSRSPALLAQSIATVDEVSGGGAVLGLGLSSNYVIEQWHGIDFQPALRRQRETIEIVQQALSGDTLDYEGDVFEVEHFRMRFSPNPDIEVGIGAQGPTNCELTGGFADMWWPNRIPLSSMADLRTHVDRGAKKQSRDPDDVDTIPFATTCVLADGNRARDRCREEIAHYIGAMGDYTKEALAEHGYGETAETVDELWEDDTEAAADAVTDELLEDITICGTPDEARAIVEDYAEVAEGLVILPSKAMSLDEIQATIRNVGEWI